VWGVSGSGVVSGSGGVSGSAGKELEEVCFEGLNDGGVEPDGCG